MGKKNEFFIGPPKNEDFNDVWNHLNTFTEKLNEATQKIPSPKDLKSVQKINQSDAIGLPSKKIKGLESEFNELRQKGMDFLGKPNFEFDSGVDIHLASLNYSSLLTLRLSTLEKDYSQAVEHIQRIEDFIHKHNSQIDANQSLKYGRNSIALGWGGILLGIISTIWGISQNCESRDLGFIQTPEPFIPLKVDSIETKLINQSSDSIIIEQDSIKGE
jgi:hypothetical protein